MTKLQCMIVVLGLALLTAPPASAQRKTGGLPPRPANGFTLVASDLLISSGFMDYLKPLFERQTGILIAIAPLPAGQALALAEHGGADALFLDDRDGELAFLAAGHAADRYDVMYGELIMVGPKRDPAGVNGMTSAIEALRLIATAEAQFLTRDDDSGVARAERRLWEEAGIDVRDGGRGWYRSTGADMPKSLAMAANLDAYALTDLASWLKFVDRRNLVVQVADDPRLIHQFGVLLINPERHPDTRTAPVKTFIEWLELESTQQAIARFTVGDILPYGPNFGKWEAEEGGQKEQGG